MEEVYETPDTMSLEEPTNVETLEENLETVAMQNLNLKWKTTLSDGRGGPVR